jgi:hypothetical protein
MLINCCGATLVTLENLATTGEFYGIGIAISLFMGLIGGPIIGMSHDCNSKLGKLIGTIIVSIVPVSMIILIACSINFNYKIKTRPVINHSCNIDISKLKCYQENYVICEDCMKSFTIKK